MRLRVLSDLHIEEAPFLPPDAQADVVVLAGDLHNGAQSVRWARQAFPLHPIVQIAGNHEFYDGEYHQVLDELRAAARESGVHFLENDAVVIDGVRFLGCTLWTDFRVFEQREPVCTRERAMELNARRIPDFMVIRNRLGAGAPEDDAPGPPAFSPNDSAAIHDASRGWLAQRLDEPFDGPTVVVTHHLPSWRSVSPAYARWISNAAFVSELDPLVARADLWVHGHTHVSTDYRLAGARIVCNPRGYPHAALRRMGLHKGQASPGDDAASEPLPETFENPGFEPALVVDVRSP